MDTMFGSITVLVGILIYSKNQNLNTCIIVG